MPYFKCILCNRRIESVLLVETIHRVSSFDINSADTIEEVEEIIEGANEDIQDENTEDSWYECPSCGRSIRIENIDVFEEDDENSIRIQGESITRTAEEMDRFMAIFGTSQINVIERTINREQEIQEEQGQPVYPSQQFEAGLWRRNHEYEQTIVIDCPKCKKNIIIEETRDGEIESIVSCPHCNHETITKNIELTAL